MLAELLFRGFAFVAIRVIRVADVLLSLLLTIVFVAASAQFITPEEVEELGIERMIGTQLLRAYMHGYFIDARLYQKV